MLISKVIEILFDLDETLIKINYCYNHNSYQPCGIRCSSLFWSKSICASPAFLFILPGVWLLSVFIIGSWICSSTSRCSVICSAWKCLSGYLCGGGAETTGTSLFLAHDAPGLTLAAWFAKNSKLHSSNSIRDNMTRNRVISHEKAVSTKIN